MKRYIARLEIFSPKNHFQAESVDVYIRENLEKENFSASLGI